MPKYKVRWIEEHAFEYPDVIDAQDQDEAQDIAFAQGAPIPEPYDITTAEVSVEEVQA